MFTNVPKKFFTSSAKIWNKEATNKKTAGFKMVSQIVKIVKRSPSSLLEDTVGCAAIFVVLLVGLSLPGMA